MLSSRGGRILKLNARFPDVPFASDGTPFGGLPGRSPVIPVHPELVDAFIARGGRIPAPINSLKN